MLRVVRMNGMFKEIDKKDAMSIYISVIDFYQENNKRVKVYG